MAEQPEANSKPAPPLMPRPCKRCGRAYHAHQSVGHTVYCARCAQIKLLGQEPDGTSPSLDTAAQHTTTAAAFRLGA